MNYKEKYSPILMGLNSTVTVQGVQVGGFLTKTAGTLSISQGGVTYVDAHPLTVGQYLPLPIGFNGADIVVTLAGGASGTLLV